MENSCRLSLTPKLFIAWLGFCEVSYVPVRLWSIFCILSLLMTVFNRRRHKIWFLLKHWDHIYIYIYNTDSTVYWPSVCIYIYIYNCRQYCFGLLGLIYIFIIYLYIYIYIYLYIYIYIYIGKLKKSNCFRITIWYFVRNRMKRFHMGILWMKSNLYSLLYIKWPPTHTFVSILISSHYLVSIKIMQHSQGLCLKRSKGQLICLWKIINGQNHGEIRFCSSRCRK